ncbi:MAG TPA: hypothetical protein PKZ41_01090, partial [Candidatus Omnitrophota bacterium]|nr:hypothetical protein [Candidatus Omnitrophota bacterium]
LYNVIFWKSTVTTYGPLWNIIADLLVRLSGTGVKANIVSFKSLLFLFHLASGYFVYLLADSENKRGSFRITFLFLLNPYIVVMNLMENHNDIVMVAFFILSLYLLKKEKYLLSTMLLTLSAGTKYLTAIFFPLFIIYAVKKTDHVGKKVSFLVKAAAANSVLAALMWSPFGMGPSSVMNAIQDIKTRLDTNSIPYLTYSIFNRLFSELSVTDFRKISDIVFLVLIFSSYAMFIFFRNNSIKTLVNMCVVILIGYFSLVSFQFGSWYILWLSPLIIFSGLPKKNMFFVLLTFAALISFWKRISFLLIAVSLIYAISFLLDTRKHLKEKPGFLSR